MNRHRPLFACALLLWLSVPPSPGRAQQMSPEDYLTLVDRADSLSRTRDYAAAAAAFGDVIAVNPYDAALWVSYASFSQRAGALETAAEAFERAIELGNDRRARTMTQLAGVYAEMGDEERAFGWLERALEEPFEARPQLRRLPQFQDYLDDPRFRELAGIADEITDRDTGWRADLDWLVEEAKRLHASFDRQAFSAEFDATAARLRDGIPELDDEAIALELQRLIVLLGDGHSAIWGVPTDRVRFPGLPIDLYGFADGIFVVGGEGPAADRIGHRVVSIGGIAVEELLQRAIPFITRDNPMGIRAAAPAMLTRMSVLRELGATADLSGAELALRGPDGAVESVRLEAGPRRPFWRPQSPAGASEELRWLRSEGPTLWMEDVAPGTVYVHYRAVRDPEGSTVQAFADSLYDVLDRANADAVIVDVRRNGGGNNFLNWPLVRTLIRFEADRSDRMIYVLTSRHTFSAAQNFANWLRRLTLAAFVGEPTGSRANFAGETTQVHLPFSGLTASISSRYWQDSHATDSRIWIAPDVPVELDSGAYFSNRDPVLEFVLRRIERRRAASD